MACKTKFNRITSLVLALLLFVMMLIPMFMVYPRAAERQYSSVLDDLKKDPDFHEELYVQYKLDDIISFNNDSDKKNDVQLASLIGIAESESSELFLYVYESCPNDCEITSVSMYYGFSQDGKNFSTEIYNLSLLSEEGVFSKYRVEGFEVSKEEDRYYNFLALFREFISGYDELSPSGRPADRAETIGQQWCTYYDNEGNIHYEMNTFNTVPITPAFCGDIVVSDGITLGSFSGVWSSQSCWFYAFDIGGYDVQRVSDVVFSYSQVNVLTYNDWDFTEEDEVEATRKEKITVSLSDENKHTVSGRGLLGKSFSYYDIQNSSDFLDLVKAKGDSVPSDVETDIKNSEFVLVFAVTERWTANTGTLLGIEYGQTNVYDCTPLEITFFDFSRTVYNMGVVADKVDPDNTPDVIIDPYDFEDLKKSFNDWKRNIEEFLEKAFAVGLLFVGVAILLSISPLMAVVKFIWNIIVTIFSFLWGILTFPLKILFRDRE